MSLPDDKIHLDLHEAQFVIQTVLTDGATAGKTHNGGVASENMCSVRDYLPPAAT